MHGCSCVVSNVIPIYHLNYRPGKGGGVKIMISYGKYLDIHVFIFDKIITKYLSTWLNKQPIVKSQTILFTWPFASKEFVNTVEYTSF